jgi:hypothetical protein
MTNETNFTHLVQCGKSKQEIVAADVELEG